MLLPLNLPADYSKRFNQEFTELFQAVVWEKIRNSKIKAACLVKQCFSENENTKIYYKNKTVNKY